MMSSSSKFDFIVREHGNVVWNGKFVPGVDGVKGAQFVGKCSVLPPEAILILKPGW